jgi:probable F420-dependent oxidoreductase
MTDPLPLDPRVRCGLVLAGPSRESALQQAREAEALGFDALWVGDHIAFHVPILESLSLLSFLAGATERVLLGTGVYLLPLRHPTLAAKAAATADLLSGGRLLFGVGVGGEYPPEFVASGVPIRERGARMDEAIPLLRRLWTEERVSHEGKHFRFGPISPAPKPVQPGGPPIWIGGRSPAAMRRAGRLGDGYVSTMTSPERYRSNLELIAKHTAGERREIGRYGTGALLFTVLDASYERAAQRAGDMLSGVYNRPFHEAARKYCLLGRSEDALEQMRTFARAGVRHFLLASLIEPEGFAREVAKQILPQLPGLLG